MTACLSDLPQTARGPSQLKSSGVHSPLRRGQPIRDGGASAAGRPRNRQARQRFRRRGVEPRGLRSATGAGRLLSKNRNNVAVPPTRSTESASFAEKATTSTSSAGDSENVQATDHGRSRRLAGSGLPQVDDRRQWRVVIEGTPSLLQASLVVAVPQRHADIGHTSRTVKRKRPALPPREVKNPSTLAERTW